MVRLSKILRNAGIGIVCLGAANSISYYASKDTVNDTPDIHKKEEIKRISKNYDELPVGLKPFYYGSKIAVSEYEQKEKER